MQTYMMGQKLDVAKLQRSKPSPTKESIAEIRQDSIAENKHTVSQTRKPDKPGAEKIGVDFITLRWSTPFVVETGGFYQITFKEYSTEPNWNLYNQEFKENKAILKGLTSNCEYVFRVRYISRDGEQTQSDASDPIKTLSSPASTLFAVSKQFAPGASPTKCILSTKENEHARNSKAKTRKLETGRSVSNAKDYKTIMVIGETGTGKTTLVDGMVNYILGVQWTDSFRFTIVTLEEEEDGRTSNQAFSQTEWITCYKINYMEGSRVPYTLSIIDVPGFGDARGLDRDFEIIEQIRELLTAKEPKGIITIDAICFVVKAPDARLTSKQRYIFHLTLSLFGKDITNNMCTMVTFADGTEPPVFAALDESGLPFGNRFTFNNGGLFAKNTASDEYNCAPMLWKIGMLSFENFFNHLGNMQGNTLQLTGEVVSERKKLEVTINHLESKLDAGLNKIDELKQVLNNMEDNRSIIKSNEQFTYLAKTTQQQEKQLPNGQYQTRCIKCGFTCHSKCVCPETQKCCKMNFNGFCIACPNRCTWNNHAKKFYHFKGIETVEVEETRTCFEKKQKYEHASEQLVKQQHNLQRLRQELEDIPDTIEDMMAVIIDCNQRLAAIALFPNALTMTDHLDLMIENEKTQKREGWLIRIQSLTKAKIRAKIFERVNDFSRQVVALLPNKGM